MNVNLKFIKLTEKKPHFIICNVIFTLILFKR